MDILLKNQNNTLVKNQNPARTYYEDTPDFVKNQYDIKHVQS